jgi:hypothetical protein
MSGDSGPYKCSTRSLPTSPVGGGTRSCRDSDRYSQELGSLSLFLPSGPDRSWKPLP